MWIDATGNRPQPDLRGRCGGCGGELVAKCGEVVSWHWAHLSGVDCDDWYEESGWHRTWKQAFVDAGCRCEVAMERDGKRHRADIVTHEGIVVEIQRGYLKPSEIAKRESFYGDGMVWIFDAREAYNEGRITIKKNPRAGKQLYSHKFHWFRPRTSITYAERSVCLDFGVGTFIVYKGTVGPQIEGFGQMTDTRSLVWRATRGTGATVIPATMWQEMDYYQDDGAIVQRRKIVQNAIDLARADGFTHPISTRAKGLAAVVESVFLGSRVVGSRPCE